MSMGEMRASSSSGGSAGTSVALVVIMSVVAIFAGGDAQRVLLTAVLTMFLYAAITFSPAVGIPLMVTYLASVGILRRYAIPIFGYTAFDPLLLVGPAVIGILFFNKLVARTISNDTPLSKWVTAVMIVMVLAAANPFQGGIAVGLSGFLFYLAPVLWYYCARDIATPKVVDATIRSILFVALIGTAYGLYQTFFGLSDVEKNWISLTNNDQGQYLANGVMRVFSIFSSFAEYVRFLCMGALIAFAWMLRRNKFAIVFCLLFFIALALSSSRGGLLTGVFGCVVIWAVMGKTYATWIPRIAVALIVGGLAMYFGLSQIKEANTVVENDTVETLLKHQAKGLLNPFDNKQSTGADHIKLFFMGVVTGFENPLGMGLGVTTIAGSKFGGVAVGVESDIGNMFISAGFIGGFIYFGCVGYAIWRSAYSWYRRRDFLSLCALGILVSSVGMWSGVAQYATTMLCWFLIGAVDRMDAEELAAKKRELGLRSASATPVPVLRTSPPGRGITV